MPDPSVTIVVLCYNQGHLLGECLQSLRDQTRQDWRALVVENGSTDGTTPGLCDSFADEQIQVLHLPHNLGIAMARQAALPHVDTEIAMRLDGDDKLAPTYLEKTVPLLLSAPDIGLAYTNYQKFGLETGVMTYRPFDEATLYRDQIIPSGALVRRSAWAGTRGQHPDFPTGNEDYDFFLTLVEGGYRGIWLNEPLYFYRIHNASWSAANDDSNYKQRLLLLQHHAAGFAKHEAAKGFLRDTYLREARRLTHIGQRWAARRMYARMARVDPTAGVAWWGIIWP